VPVPDTAAVVVMDTGARRSLAGSAYNDRRSACERVLAELARRDPQVRALRDVTEAQLEAAKSALDPTDLRRARHVVPENRRPVEMAEALRAGDLGRAGRLMNDSHASLRDLYEVSSVELDVMTEVALRQSSCHGARMTGAGFGGCAVALVETASVPAFCEAVLAGYRERIELPAALYPCRPQAGARLLD
jgi:galactokinase